MFDKIPRGKINGITCIMDEDDITYVVAQKVFSSYEEYNKEMNLQLASKDLLEALETALNGLLWYHDMYPEHVCDSDYEAIAQINNAIQKATGAPTSV